MQTDIAIPLISRHIIFNQNERRWITDFSIANLEQGHAFHSRFAREACHAHLVSFCAQPYAHELTQRLACVNGELYNRLYYGTASPPQFPRILTIPHPLIIVAHGVQMIADAEVFETMHQHSKVWSSHRGQFPLLSCFDLSWFYASQPFFRHIDFLAPHDRELQMLHDRYVMNLLVSETLAAQHYHRYSLFVPNHYLFADALAGTFGTWVRNIKSAVIPYLARAPEERPEMHSPGGSLFGPQEALREGYADLLFLEAGATTLLDILSILFMLRINYTSVRMICCRGVLGTYEGAGGVVHTQADIPLPRTILNPPGRDAGTGPITLTLPPRRRKQDP